MPKPEQNFSSYSVEVNNTVLKNNIMSLLLITLVIGFITLCLVDNASLVNFYKFLARSISVSPDWINKNVQQISTAGHFIGGFVISTVALHSRTNRGYTLIFLAILFFGCELLQNFTSTRQFSLSDLAVNFAGVCLAITFVSVQTKITLNLSKSLPP